VIGVTQRSFVPSETRTFLKKMGYRLEESQALTTDGDEIQVRS